MPPDKNTDSQQPDPKEESVKTLDQITGPRVSRFAGELPIQHKFWDTQPVPKLTLAENEKIGALDRVKTVDEVRKEAYPLPGNFEWVVLDIDLENDLNEVYELLAENYVEDNDALFRFNYPRVFLKWAMQPPGYHKEWILGIKCGPQLMALITAIPVKLSIWNTIMEMAEVNFLCIHKCLRSRRLAPVLIREITRRINLKNIWQAVYTAGILLPKPVAKTHYYHRALNYRKLVDVGFSRLPARLTMKAAEQLYSVDPNTTLSTWRPMKVEDMSEVEKMLREFSLEKDHKLFPMMSVEEVGHWLLPRDDVMYSYVRESDDDHRILDFFSFYSLPSTVIQNTKGHTEVRAAYYFYSVAKTATWLDLFHDMLTIAKRNNFDVFNCLDMAENAKVLSELKFGIGDGSLRYYLFNWSIPEVAPSQVGLVML